MHTQTTHISSRNSEQKARAIWAAASQRLPEVTNHMRDCIAGGSAHSGSGAVIDRAISHHLSRPGKQFRARLALASAQSLGVHPDAALTLATACELLHNASLVHDDMQDKDTLRRGIPSVWGTFGDGVALCLGDLMLSQTYGLLAACPTPATIRSALVALFATQVQRVIAGQVEEATARSDRTDIPGYDAMVRGKSGALFALPVLGALLLAERPHNEHRAAENALGLWGVAYQIKDDVLDMYGEKEGREPGGDLADGQVNALVIHHLLAADVAERERFADFMDQPQTDSTSREAWRTRICTPATLASTLAHQARALHEAEAACTALPPTLCHTLEEAFSAHGTRFGALTCLPDSIVRSA